MQVGHFEFSSNFDSGNGGKIRRVRKDSPIIKAMGGWPYAFAGNADWNMIRPISSCGCNDPYEYHVSVSPDCAQTANESHCRTWFYFRVRGMTS